MTQQELKKKVLEVFGENKIGTLATVKNNRPHSRYMTFFNDEFTLHTPTNKNTHKAEEIEENPYVHILLGYEGEGLGDKYIEIEGKATISKSDKLKEELWKEDFKHWFDGKDDPNYIILEIEPSSIRLMNSGEEPQSIEL